MDQVDDYMMQQHQAAIRAAQVSRPLHDTLTFQDGDWTFWAKPNGIEVVRVKVGNPAPPDFRPATRTEISMWLDVNPEPLLEGITRGTETK